MKHIIKLLVLFIIQINYSQKQEIINPKGKWFFGVEMGQNYMFTGSEKNFSLTNNYTHYKTSSYGGIRVEYYTKTNWSLTCKILYYETGMSFIIGEDKKKYGTEFNGENISIPIYLKRDFRIYKNLKGNFKLGLSYNLETKNKYINQINQGNEYHSENYFSLIYGFGLNYFLNQKSALFLDFDNFTRSPNKGHTTGLIVGKKNYFHSNQLIGFGYKYSFQ